MDRSTNAVLVVLTGLLLGLGLWELLDSRPTQRTGGFAADRRKMRGDWERVGHDIRSARRRHEQEQARKAA